MEEWKYLYPCNRRVWVQITQSLTNRLGDLTSPIKWKTREPFHFIGNLKRINRELGGKIYICVVRDKELNLEGMKPETLVRKTIPPLWVYRKSNNYCRCEINNSRPHRHSKKFRRPVDEETRTCEWEAAPLTVHLHSLNTYTSHCASPQLLVGLGGQVYHTGVVHTQRALWILTLDTQRNQQL
jgi:hypothetical protein